MIMVIGLSRAAKKSKKDFLTKRCGFFRFWGATSISDAVFGTSRPNQICESSVNGAKSVNKALIDDHARKVVSCVIENSKTKPLEKIVEAVSKITSDTAEKIKSRASDPIQDAFDEIANEIVTLRHELAQLQPNEMALEKIPDAGKELAAVVESTEEATDTIMEAAESIMACENEAYDDYRGYVETKLLEVFEACSFQDLTGQRISKVVKTLNHIEGRVSALVNQVGLDRDEEIVAGDGEIDADEERARKLLLNGPQMKADAIDQSYIDDLLK